MGNFVEFAEGLTAGRVERLAVQLDRGREDIGEAVVHDLRVAARRLLSAIDCFRRVQWGGDIRKLRKRAKRILAAGREVRDRDIAIGLAAAAGLSRASPMVLALERQRNEAGAALQREIGRKRFRKFAGKWAGKLGGGCSVASQSLTAPRSRWIRRNRPSRSRNPGP